MEENKIIYNMLKPFHIEQSGDNFFYLNKLDSFLLNYKLSKVCMLKLLLQSENFHAESYVKWFLYNLNAFMTIFLKKLGVW